MPEFWEIHRRLDALSARARRVPGDARLLAEMEDVLDQGYVSALSGDARHRRLGERLDVLLADLEAPGSAGQARRIARDRRTLERSTRELRSRLAVLRTQLLRLAAAGSGSS